MLVRQCNFTFWYWRKIDLYYVWVITNKWMECDNGDIWKLKKRCGLFSHNSPKCIISAERACTTLYQSYSYSNKNHFTILSRACENKLTSVSFFLEHGGWFLPYHALVYLYILEDAYITFECPITLLTCAVRQLTLTLGFARRWRTQSFRFCVFVDYVTNKQWL